MTQYRGRFAPSPTGELHFGSLVAALASFLDAKSQHGQWLLRIEDIDPPREQPGAGGKILEQLHLLGFVADEPVLWQRQRLAAYEAAVSDLLRRGHAFECRCSRSDLGPAGIHLGRCRSGTGQKRAAAIRVRAPALRLGFIDRIQGAYSQQLDRDVGDFVIRRADGLYAYQLAVVVDDAHQQITDVVRGSDLLDSTPRQIWLQRCLGLPTPRYAHLPLALDKDGNKLSKQSFAPALPSTSPQTSLARALAFLGQTPVPEGARIAGDDSLAAKVWSIERIPRESRVEWAV